MRLSMVEAIKEIHKHMIGGCIEFYVATELGNIAIGVDIYGDTDKLVMTSVKKLCNDDEFYISSHCRYNAVVREFSTSFAAEMRAAEVMIKVMYLRLMNRLPNDPAFIDASLKLYIDHINTDSTNKLVTHMVTEFGENNFTIPGTVKRNAVIRDLVKSKIFARSSKANEILNMPDVVNAIDSAETSEEKFYNGLIAVMQLEQSCCDIQRK